MKKIIIAVLLLFLGFNAYSQEELTRILFVFDASNSMNKKWGDRSRLYEAKKILSNAVDSLRGAQNLDLALRVYGHQYPVAPTYQNCNDTKLEIPFGGNNTQAILNRIKTIQAKGTTPIARSLEQAADDFPDDNAKNIIILITDGIEACDGDPCAIATKLHEKGVSVSPFIIGLGMDLSYLKDFECIGNYKAAEDPIAFKTVLKNIIDKTLVNTTAQINLNTEHNRPTETDVTLFLYKAGTKDLKYTFTHTLNERGLPDTLVINPDIEYDLVVKTLPQQIKKNIKLQKNTHNTIEVPAPQGELKVQFKNSTKYDFVNVRVMEHNQNNTLNVQNFREQQKYIIGKYDLEILTLPRRYETVKISQSSLKTVYVEAPGVMTFKSYKPVTAQLFEVKNNNQFEWVCDLDERTTSEKVVLQPGKYKIVYRQLDMKETNYTREKTFSVYSNKTKTINL